MPEEKHHPQVFISYSRRDPAFVEQLAADLQAAGLDVWYDLSVRLGRRRMRSRPVNLSQYNSVIEAVVSRGFVF